jgi:thiol-disulfide isomerase/thioredoxin
MKNLILILILIPFISYTQSDVPEEYWIDDTNFEKKVTGDGFEETDIVVVEFWAEFNRDNCFVDWDQLEVPYYRVDISKAPEAKKKYKVRMAPTIIIFKEGYKEAVFKAGLDLLLPTDLQEINNTIEDIRKAGAY